MCECLSPEARITIKMRQVYTEIWMSYATAVGIKIKLHLNMQVCKWFSLNIIVIYICANNPI